MNNLSMKWRVRSEEIRSWWKQRQILFEPPQYKPDINGNCTFTENTLPRYYAKEISCPICGYFMNKQTTPHFFENAKNGDFIRKWRFPCHGAAYYAENVSELRRLGVER